jgi:S1-C subfamily serine protease
MAKRRDDRFETCSRFVSALAAANKSGDEDIVILDEDHVSARPSKPVAPASQRTVRTSESKTAESRTAVTGSNRPPRTDKRVEEPAAKTTPPSKPAVVSADRKTDQLDDVDILEDHDLTEVDDDRITASRKDRKRVSKPDRRNKTECDLDQVNAKAQRWILILGGCAALFVVGLIGFAAWAGMNSFFKPSTPDRSNGHEIANSTPDGGQNSGSNNAANSDKSKLNPVVPPENKTAQLRYGWEQAKPYVYTVKVELEPDPDVVVTMTGNSTYTLGQPIARKRNDPDSGQGTGTGFVVQAGGYLVTCQHVVEDASEIEVAIGGKKYPAKVIIEDVEHDLALIKIEANGLSTLPLANSDQVQVGEEVRAIGFPLSSILGDNIKATRGTISGVNQEDDRKVFQVDAGINPGNSGGPLVNERGEVIGVNFAKLREEMATNVGFAVPINDAATLLRGEGVAFTNGNGKGAKLDGPELVKRVSAATALITVTTGNGPANGLHHYELKCTGSLNSSVKSKSGKIDPQATLAMQRQHLRAAMNTTFTEPDIVETDALGRVHEITGGRSSLPGYMGPMSIMVLEQFPSGRRTNWSNRFAVTIVINESNDDNVPFPRFRPRFRPPGFPGFPGFNDNPQKTTRIPGKVRVAYTLQEAIGDLQKIKKEFDLEAREDGAADTRIKLTGSGVFTFNTRTGVPRSLEYAATLIENEQNKTSRLPIRLSYQISEDRPPNQNVAQAPPDPVNPPAAVEHPVPHEITQRFTKEEIDQCLTDLRGGHAGRSSIAAAKLLRAVPLDERRDEVLKSLEAMLADKDQFRRKQAVDAMGTWAKPETIPVLIRCLDESALLVKLAAIDALGRLKDQRAAEPLAKLLAEPGPRVQAAKALKLLGEKAESAVVGLLKHADPDVRREACRLLKDIGTSSSLTDLQTACSDEDRTVATLAKEAVTAISNRK